MPILKDKPYNFKESSIPEEAWKQKTYWYDRKGNQYKISEMNYFHTVNALKVICLSYPHGMGTKLFKAMTDHATDLKRNV